MIRPSETFVSNTVLKMNKLSNYYLIKIDLTFPKLSWKTFNIKLSSVDFVGPIPRGELRTACSDSVGIIGIGERIGPQKPPDVFPVIDNS